MTEGAPGRPRRGARPPATRGAAISHAAFRAVIAALVVLAASVAPLRAVAQPGAPDRGMPPPPAMPAGDLGFLRLETDAPDTRLVVDGVEVGADPSTGEPARVVALPAGVHQVALARPGYAPVAVAVEIFPGRTSVVRWPPRGVTREASGDGYQVIPPRATAPDRPPDGSGYFVVPRP